MFTGAKKYISFGIFPSFFFFTQKALHLLFSCYLMGLLLLVPYIKYKTMTVQGAINDKEYISFKEMVDQEKQGRTFLSGSHAIIITMFFWGQLHAAPPAGQNKLPHHEGFELFLVSRAPVSTFLCCVLFGVG